MRNRSYPRNVNNKVERNFLIGDRVKTYFKGKWFAGEVVEIYFKDNSWNLNKILYILVKTDEKADNELDALLKGFGLEGEINNLRTIFEYENEKRWGDDISHEEITWEMIEKKKKEYNK